jgi:hypothetical protein
MPCGKPDNHRRQAHAGFFVQLSWTLRNGAPKSFSPSEMGKNDLSHNDPYLE